MARGIKKRVTTKLPTPKYKVGDSTFIIDKRFGKVLQGKIEVRNTVAVPVRNEVNRIVGEQEEFFYTIVTNNGSSSYHENELYPDLRSVSLAFTRLYTSFLD